jgi:hypothetical protein
MNSFNKLFCNDNARRFMQNRHLISATYNCLRETNIKLDTYLGEIKFHFLVGIYVLLEIGIRQKKLTCMHSKTSVYVKVL